jgi:hypothetical protein
MTSLDALFEHKINVRDFVELVNDFAKTEDSEFKGFRAVYLFAQELRQREEGVVTISTLFEQAANFHMEGNLETAGGDTPLATALAAFNPKEWVALLAKIPPEDRVSALALLCSTVGGAGGFIAGPVFAGMVVLVVLLREVREVLT